MRSAGIAAGLFFVFSTLCLPQAALAQSDRPPFPKDESARLGAEIRKDPENDLLRPFGRTLKQPPENVYKLITSAAALQDSKRPGDLEKAVGLLKRAANSAAWYVDIYLNLALAYDEAQNWAQAKRYYELFLYAGKDYSFVSAEIGIMEEALRRVEGELAKGGRR
jgi:tetratricopeptide (TPR) repeat protein